MLSYKFNILDDSHPKVEEVPGLNIELMNHQKTSLYHCEILEKNQALIVPWEEDQSYYHYSYREVDIEPTREIYFQFGIIACKVGAGKSFVCLSLILRHPLLNFNRLLSAERNSLCYSFKKISTNNYTVPTNTILVPHNLFNQWKTYITTRTNLQAYFISTNKDFAPILQKMEQYKVCMDDIHKKINVDQNTTDASRLLEELTYNKVYLVSNKIWNIFADEWRKKINKKISRIFIDEVHSINLPNSTRIACNFIWFITSSIQDLSKHHNLGFIRDTIESYHSLGQYQNYVVIKNKDDYVDASLQLEVPMEHTIKCKASVLLNIFDGIITQSVREMLLAEDYQGVIEQMGLKEASTENLISVLCANLQSGLQNAKLKYEAKQKMHYVNEAAKASALEKAREKIAVFDEKIECVKQRIMASNIDPIMHTDIENPVITDCCKNKFDLESITSYYDFQFKKNSNVNCPMCRQPLYLKKLVYLGQIERKPVEAAAAPEGYVFEEHTKMENLEHLLKNVIPLDKRVLIFSEHEGNLQEIADVFTKAGRPHLSPLKGTINHISNLIKEYNEGIIPNLFLNAKYCGSGLNLEKTDIIIIMHKMTKDNIGQVIGRGNRIGRVGRLEVYFLYAQNE